MAIIQSLLDLDFYKLTMGHLTFHNHPDVTVTFGFKNRTVKVRLAEEIDLDRLRMELDHIRDLRFTLGEIQYLRDIRNGTEPMFCEEYLQFLSQLTLPEYELKSTAGQLELLFRGSWVMVTYWETLALSIVNELYYEYQLAALNPVERELVYEEGKKRLAEKVRILLEHPEITFCDFGTRRRFGREWQEYVVRTLSECLPKTQFLGTSNVYLAMKYGLLPMGTSAHELFMVFAGIFGETDEILRSSHNRVLQEWWDLYGFGLSVALTDTYGTDFFFRDMTAEQARAWKGLRHDSGDPIAFGENAIAFYQRHGIDSREKLLVYSDGLELDVILKLSAHFAGRIKVTFGWGTNLTNDLGFEPLSLVVKVFEACGRSVAKLSDNINKATGKLEDIERAIRVFNYDMKEGMEVKY